MCYYIQSLKVRGIWIIISSVFLSLFYIAYQINVANISKPLLIEIVNIKERMGYNDKNRENKHSETSSNERESIISTSATGIFHNVSSPKHPNSSLNRVNSSSKSTDDNFKSKLKIGILIPTTTRKIKNPLVEKLSLTTICLPSLYKTMEGIYSYVVYVGIDKGDYLETVKDKLETMFDNLKTVVTHGRSYTMTVNEIARKAYGDGMDYFVRINDDSTMETQNWTSKAISVLQNYTPRNIGIVGPTCREGNTAILTHDMVHRSHIEIFDFYYPPYLDNWWTDDWITKVYSPGRSTKLPSWVMKHHLASHGTRYNVDFKKHIRLNKTLTIDKERLGEYLSSLQK